MVFISCQINHQSTSVGSADSGSVFPRTQAEERTLLAKTYDDIKVVDSAFYNGNDTLRFQLKYYCLKYDTLIIPQNFNSHDSDQKEFITHPFATHILLIHNTDTILNREFKASDFNSFFTDEFNGALKKHESLLMPELEKRNRDQDRIVLLITSLYRELILGRLCI